MKRNVFLPACIVAFSVFLLASCSKSNDSTNNATPASFIGSWTCQEHSSKTGSSTYTVHINQGSNSAQVIIENLYNFGFNKTCNGNTSGTSLTIPSQLISGTGNTISGSGNMVGSNSISMNYVVNDGSAPDTCSAVLNRQ